MSSEYEKQLEEANQRLREQLEKETARADMLEKKLKENEWRGLKYSAKDDAMAYQEMVLKEMYKQTYDISKKYDEFTAIKKKNKL